VVHPMTEIEHQGNILKSIFMKKSYIGTLSSLIVTEGWAQICIIPVSILRLNGGLLVLPFRVYKLIEYVVPGCRPKKQTDTQFLDQG